MVTCSDFIWFVSASFRLNRLGIFQNIIDVSLIAHITCHCEELFIDSQFSLTDPHKIKIICRDNFINNILRGIVFND